LCVVSTRLRPASRLFEERAVKEKPPPIAAARRLPCAHTHTHACWLLAFLSVCPQGNKISTGKYTLLSFLPKNLFEQFQRVANCYFLFQLCLQLYEPIASLDWQSTFVPLVFVLSVTAAKDGYDDFKRHRMDKKINNLKVRRWDPYVSAPARTHAHPTSSPSPCPHRRRAPALRARCQLPGNPKPVP